jgi:hypothetical protein
VLIAGVLVLVIALSTLPLLLRSIANSSRGAEATLVSQFASAELDTGLQLPFDEVPLTLAEGSTELVTSAVQTLEAYDGSSILRAPDDTWMDSGITTTDPVLWTRTTRIRQFGLSDLTPIPGSNLTSLDLPLPGGTSPDFVHLKEIEVRILGSRKAGVLGVGQDMTIRVLKAY